MPRRKSRRHCTRRFVVGNSEFHLLGYLVWLVRRNSLRQSSSKHEKTNMHVREATANAQKPRMTGSMRNSENDCGISGTKIIA